MPAAKRMQTPPTDDWEAMQLRLRWPEQVQYGEEPLAYYTVKVNRRGDITAVTEPRRLPSQYQSPQPWLWPLSAEERLFVLPVPKRRSRRRRRQVGVQGWFTADRDE